MKKNEGLADTSEHALYCVLHKTLSGFNDLQAAVKYARDRGVRDIEICKWRNEADYEQGETPDKIEHLLIETKEDLFIRAIKEHIDEYIAPTYTGDFVVITVCSEYFYEIAESRFEENGIDIFEDSPAIEEVSFVVNKKWLYDHMKKKCGIEKPDKYLEEEYTSDDSFNWFCEAADKGMVFSIKY